MFVQNVRLRYITMLCNNDEYKKMGQDLSLGQLYDVHNKIKDTRRNGQPPKSQLAKKVNLLRIPNIAFLLFYTQVDFLVS
jgi:hypothetical protein